MGQMTKQKIVGIHSDRPKQHNTEEVLINVLPRKDEWYGCETTSAHLTAKFPDGKIQYLYLTEKEMLDMILIYGKNSKSKLSHGVATATTHLLSSFSTPELFELLAKEFERRADFSTPAAAQERQEKV